MSKAKRERWQDAYPGLWELRKKALISGDPTALHLVAAEMAWVLTRVDACLEAEGYTLGTDPLTGDGAVRAEIRNLLAMAKGNNQ